MSRPNHVKTLEKKYARLKGYYFHIEKEAEDFDGEELIDKQNEIIRRQRKITQSLLAIEKTIQMWEPSWIGENIKPIRVVRKSPVRKHQSDLIYEYIWATNESFTVTDVVEYLDGKYAELGITPLSRIRHYTSVTALLHRQEGRIIELVEREPLTWRLLENHSG